MALVESKVHSTLVNASVSIISSVFLHLWIIFCKFVTKDLSETSVPNLQKMIHRCKNTLEIMETLAFTSVL